MTNSTTPALPPRPRPSFVAPAWVVAKCGPVKAGGWFSADELDAYAIQATADLTRQLDEARAEVERLRVDAERWQRWLPWMRRLNRIPFDLAIELDAITAAQAAQAQKELT